MYTIDQMHEYTPKQLSTEYFKILRSNCIYCKHPIVINENRTIMRCSNSNCPKHTSYRAANMFSEMGVDRIGPGKAYEIIVKNNLKTHLDILGLTIDELPNKYSEDHKKQIYISLQKGREQTINNILAYFQLDNIGDKKATSIMKDFSSFEDFFNRNDSYMKVLEHIRKSLRQSEFTETLIKMAYHMFKNKDSLIRAEKYFKVTKLVDEKIRVCITGEVLSVFSPNMAFKPRKNFIDLMNKKYEGIVSFVNSGSNLNDTDFLLTDSTRKTSKFEDATSLGVPIKSFSQFTELLEQAFGEGNEEIIINRRN